MSNNVSLKRRAALAAIASIPLAGLQACGGSSETVSPAPTPTPTPGTQAKTTLLIYMVASDLETNDAAATHNIDEMKLAAPSSDVQVILQRGGSKTAAFQTSLRQRLNQQNFEDVQNLGALDMGVPGTLSDFLTWGVKTYPADRYMVILWDHGGGPINGFGSDENTGHTISGIDLISAMQTAYAATGTRFDLIGFDACLMASVETATAIAPYGRYLMASQDIEPGGGWEYTGLLNALTADPSIDPVSFSKLVIDGYYAKNRDNTDNNYLTSSLVDLSKVGAVANALSTVAQQWRNQISSEGVQGWAALIGARNLTDRFFTTRFPFPYQTELFDLGQLVASPSATSGAAGATLASALNAAVVYKRNGQAHGQATGLTVYFPALGLTEIQKGQTQTQLQRYLNANTVPAYCGFLQTHRDFVASSPDVMPALTPVVAASGSFSSTFTNGWGNDGSFAALINPQTDVVESIIEVMPTGSSSLDVDSTATWPMLNGSPVVMRREWSPASSVNDPNDYKKLPGQYSIPVYFYFKNYALIQTGVLRLTIDAITGQGTFDGLIRTAGAVPLATRGMTMQEISTNIASMFHMLIGQNGLPKYLGSSIDFSNGFTIDFKAAPAGSYLVTLGMSDFAGRWVLAPNPLPLA